MMRSRWLYRAGVGVIACVAALPFAASAQSAPAFTNSPSIVYAGPGGDYPQVARLQGGSPLSVMGCVPNYEWCDVAMPGLRGWVYGGQINYAYQGGAVPLMTYGPQIGVPIVGFAIGAYWNNYYRGRPWYHDQRRWENRPPPGPGFRGGPGPQWHGDNRRPEGPGPRVEYHGGPGPGPGPRPEFHGGPGPGHPQQGHEGGHPQQGPQGSQDHGHDH